MKFVFPFCLLLITLISNAQPPALSENIFIITTDGFRWQEIFNGADSLLINDSRFVQDISLMKQLYWDPVKEIRRQKLMPFLWHTIAQQGQLYGNRIYGNRMNVSNLYKISYPGYNEMLTGYPDPVFIPNVPLWNRNTNVLEYLNHTKEFKGKVAAFSSWNIFSSILNSKRNKFPINCGYQPMPDDSTEICELINESQNQITEKKHTRFDLLTFLNARQYIEYHEPRVVLIGFGETDEFAHSGRYDNYLQQASNVDRMIAELWYFVQTNTHYRNKTTFIITTDHGRGKNSETWVKHGILTGGSGETWMAIIGPGIQPCGEMKNTEQFFEKQIASTIAAVLGEEFKTSKNKGSAIQLPVFFNTGFVVANKNPAIH